MIKHYTDHAANERTFLAWVRTAIAVSAFGFLIERFDLVLSALAGSSPRASAFRPRQFGNEVALAFILLGVAMIIVASVRFFRLQREIDRDDVVHRTGSLFDLVLGALLLLLLVLSLFLYVSRGALPI
jgi:putative membrane protein